jgi:Ca2+:H+ antiporter
MVAGKTGSETLARDAAFAAVMLILNGLVGLSLLIGGDFTTSKSFSEGRERGACGARGAVDAFFLRLAAMEAAWECLLG